MVKSAALLTAASVAMLSGCAAAQTSGQTSATSGTIRDTRAFIGTSADECPDTGGGREAFGAFIGALAVPIIESVVKEAVGALGNAIEEAAKNKEKTVTAVAAGNDILSGRCLVVVRGKFGLSIGSAATATKDKFFRQIGLADDSPELYAELVIVRDNDQNASAFRLELQSLDYRTPLLDGLSQKRDLVLAAVFQTPSKKSEKDESAAFGVAGVSLDDAEAGQPPLRRSDALKAGKTTAWMPIPVGPDKKPIGPYSVFVSVTETREGSKFMKFLSGVFKPNQETIAKEGAKIIVDLTGLKKD